MEVKTHFTKGYKDCVWTLKVSLFKWDPEDYMISGNNIKTKTQNLNVMIPPNSFGLSINLVTFCA